jgi:hypothetical protein
VSRQIDLSKKLSAEDREYLTTRSRLDDIRQNDEQFGDAEEKFVPIDGGNTGDVDPFKRDDGHDLLSGTHPGEKVLTPVQAIETGQDPESIKAPATEPTVQNRDAAGDEDDDYEDEEDGKPVWTKEDLEEELQKRDLPKSGTKAELIKRLREDDKSDA